MRLARERVPGWMEQIGHTLALAVWGNHGPTIVHWEESPQAVTANLRLGDVMPLLSSATGRCFAAYMPPEAVAPLLQQGAGPGRQAAAHRPARHAGPGAGRAGRCARAWHGPVVDTLLPGIVAFCARCLMRAATWRWASPRWARWPRSTRNGVAPSRCRCALPPPSFPPTWALAAHEPLRLPPGLLHCQGPLMPRRTLWILTALVLAVHWLVLQGVPLAWDGSAAPAARCSPPAAWQRRRLR